MFYQKIYKQNWNFVSFFYITYYDKLTFWKSVKYYLLLFV